MTNILDLRTVLFSHVISAAISALVMVSLYVQNRSRTPELVCWPTAFILQFIGILLISFRGLIPDLFSVILGNSLILFQALLIIFGISRFYRKPIPLGANIALVLIFIALHTVFTYAQPSLIARNLNFSIALFLICAQGFWFIFHKIKVDIPLSTRMTGLIFAAYCLFSIMRIISDLAYPPGASLLTSPLPDTLIILGYQMLSIGLTFSLILIINRHLVTRLEDDLQKRSAVEGALRESEEKFSKAFHNMPDALVISMAGTAKILAVNDSFEEISGFSSEEAVGKSALQDLNLWVNSADREAFVRQLRKTGQVVNYEAKFRRKNGQFMDGMISGETIQLTQGECFLLIIRDVTERKKIEQAEVDQRILAEALRDTATALTSTLKSDEVLDRILENIGKVVPNDTANFMLLSEDDQLSIVRSRGYTERGLKDLHGMRSSLHQLPLLIQVMASGRPTAFPDVLSEPDWKPQEITQWIRSYAVAPILARGRIIGFLNLDSAIPGYFNQEMADRLQAFADQASIAIENARLYEDVQDLAITDSLTGLFNRRGLFQLGEREVTRSQRFQHPLAVLMVDIDNFKSVNDTYGHQTGDRVLAVLAACLRSQVRNVDLLARYGGEEFTILLTETNRENAVKAAERLRLAVADLDIPVGGTTSGSLRVTISLGLVMLTSETLDLSHLLFCADQAMYTAKNEGRNRVVVGQVNCMPVEKGITLG
jgi:diguanylate cyclase (GGDEF)-like protein/PAS domain S-box-containing protein